MFIKGKRGDISVSMLVTVIILIVGFAILLFAYYQINWSGSIDNQVCHQSIIERGTLPSESKEFVPLTCPTAKICLTANLIGKGNCEEFKNEKGIVTIRVGDGDGGIEDIQRAYAQEIVSCWEMVGQGKISLYSNFLAENYGLGTVSPSCIICSRVAIDKNSFNDINFSKINLNSYMNTHLVPGKDKTYFQYMTGDPNAAPVKLADSISLGKISLVNAAGKTESIDGANVELDSSGSSFSQDSKNNIPETAILFSQISAPDYGSVFRNDLTSLVGGYAGYRAFAPGVVKSIITKASTAVAWWAKAAIVLAVGGYQAYSISSNRATALSYCGDMSVGSKSYSGCSTIRTVDYSAENVLKYCEYVESIS